MMQEILTTVTDWTEGNRSPLEEREDTMQFLAEGSAPRLVECHHSWETQSSAPGEQAIGTGSSGCDHESGRWNPHVESLMYTKQHAVRRSIHERV